jgi:hypothetical protein
MDSKMVEKMVQPREKHLAYQKALTKALRMDSRMVEMKVRPREKHLAYQKALTKALRMDSKMVEKMVRPREKQWVLMMVELMSHWETQLARL